MNTHKQALEKYKVGFSDPNKSYYDSVLNIMMSWAALIDSGHNWYEDLSDYIFQSLNLGSAKIPKLQYAIDSYIDKRGSTLAIHFISDILDSDALEKMFGRVGPGWLIERALIEPMHFVKAPGRALLYINSINRIG